MTAPEGLFNGLTNDQLTEVWHLLNSCRGTTERHEARRARAAAWIHRTVKGQKSDQQDGDWIVTVRTRTIRRIRAACHEHKIDPLDLGVIIRGATLLATTTLENCDNDQLAKVETLLDDVTSSRRTIGEVRVAVHELAERFEAVRP